MQVEAFFDDGRTFTLTYVVYDEHSKDAVVIDPVLDLDTTPWRTFTESIEKVARSNATVMVLGETGVGKEHVVRILHASSDRAAGPLQVVNCTAIPADLLEAELFGIEAGVATGVSRRRGKLRLANGGILFLDEIGDMDPALQARIAVTQGSTQP